MCVSKHARSGLTCGFMCPQVSFTAETHALPPSNANASVERDEPKRTSVALKTNGLKHLISLPRPSGFRTRKIHAIRARVVRKGSMLKRQGVKRQVEQKLLEFDDFRAYAAASFPPLIGVKT